MLSGPAIRGASAGLYWPPAVGSSSHFLEDFVTIVRPAGRPRRLPHPGGRGWVVRGRPAEVVDRDGVAELDGDGGLGQPVRGRHPTVRPRHGSPPPHLSLASED